MPRHPRILLAGVAMLVLAVVTYAAAGMYTFAGTVSAQSRAVQSLITRTLDSTNRHAALASEFLGLRASDTLPPPSALAYPVAGWRQPTSYSLEARTWARRGVTTDPEGLRGWLGRRVFATQRAAGDTVILTWRRLSWRTGCPWISTLQAALVERPDRGLHVARVTATCPATPR